MSLPPARVSLLALGGAFRALPLNTWRVLPARLLSSSASAELSLASSGAVASFAPLSPAAFSSAVSTASASLYPPALSRTHWSRPDLVAPRFFSSSASPSPQVSAPPSSAPPSPPLSSSPRPAPSSPPPPHRSLAVVAPHFKSVNKTHPLHGPPQPMLVPDRDLEETKAKSVWSAEEVLSVEESHLTPQSRSDRAALLAIRVMRRSFDLFSGYVFGPVNEHKLLRRIIFLETVAGIPGMVAGSLRHLESLRAMRLDRGWIHALLEEAENERMHLMCFTQLRNPGLLFRFCALMAQGIFWNAYFLTYLLSPTTCHRFVGYLEEEAVRTYTHAIEAYDAGMLGTWQGRPAPDLAKRYWNLADDATMRDVLLAVRADESNHRDVNHALADTDRHGKFPLDSW